MIIRVNGAEYRVPGPITVTALVATLQLRHRFAVEVNQAIIPRSGYDQRLLRAGDVVEIIQAVGGG